MKSLHRNPLKMPNYFDTLVCLGNELVIPNPLKFLNFLDTLLYLVKQLVSVL